jgi:hypothetical protein
MMTTETYQVSTNRAEARKTMMMMMERRRGPLLCPFPLQGELEAHLYADGKMIQRMKRMKSTQLQIQMHVRSTHPSPFFAQSLSFFYERERGG